MFIFFFLGALVFGLFVNLASDHLPLILGKTLFAQFLWIVNNHNCPCFGSLFKSISLHLLVFVTASPAPHLAEREFKHFPFSDRIPILRI